MARHKNLFAGVRVEQAGRKRKCYHDVSHQIVKGDQVLEVKAGMHWKGYCCECARHMLEAARKSITVFASKLQSQQNATAEE